MVGLPGFFTIILRVDNFMIKNQDGVKKNVRENYECTKVIFFASYIIMTLLE